MGPQAALDVLAPTPPRHHLARARLVERVLDAEEPVVALVAPAGCGRTTLVAELAAAAPRTAVRTLDGRDNDPVRLWVGVLGALRELDPSLRPRTEPAGGDGEGLQTLVASSVATLAGPAVLVLEDLHRIFDPELRAGIALMAGRLPAAARLVLTSRRPLVDPPFAALRLRGELAELDEDDLALDDEEARTLLRAVAGSELDDALLAPVVARTGGWATGIRLAADALRRAADPAAAAAAWSGASAGARAWLRAEVLDRQPPDLRTFAVEVSVLDVPTPEAAGRVTGRSDAAVKLQRLEAAGCFLRAEGRDGGGPAWHPAFLAFLRAERAGLPAARQATLERAARPEVAELPRPDRLTTCGAWLVGLPEAVAAADPVLALGRAWVALARGAPDDALAWSERAEAHADPDGRTATHAACVRAAAHAERGELAPAEEWAGRARELLDARSRHADAAARRAMADALGGGVRPAAPPALREPLSDGERAVVALLPRDLTLGEIAAERYVSVNTVKTQVRSIYRKLGVRTRAGAVERLHELGLAPDRSQDHPLR